jgi:SPP1 gp7 family putative phage head morphogenesis protein
LNGKINPYQHAGLDRTQTRLEQGDVLKELAVAESSHFLSWGFNTFPNPDELVQKKGLIEYDKMRRDEQVTACQEAKIKSRLSTGYEIKVGLEGNKLSEELADFIRDQLDSIQGTFNAKLKDILTARYYGFSITEKVFEIIEQGRFEGKIGLKNLKTKPPFDYEFKTDEFRNLLGIVNRNTAFRSVKGQDERLHDVGSEGNPFPPSKFVIYSANKEFGNFYGQSDLRPVWKVWWSKNFVMKFYNIFLERFGMPAIVATYPDSVGQDQAVLGVIDDMLTNYQAKSGFRVPEEVKIDLLEATRTGKPTYGEAIALYDLKIARGLLCPDMATQGGEKGGSFALSKQRFSLFVLILDEMGYEIEDVVMDDQIIKPLITMNYGTVPTELLPHFKFNSISEENVEMKSKIIDILIKAEVVHPEEEWIRDFTNIPDLDPVIKAKMEAEKKEREEKEKADQKALVDAKKTEAQNIIPDADGNEETGKQDIKDTDAKKEDIDKSTPFGCQHFQEVFEDDELRRQPNVFEEKIQPKELADIMTSYEDFMQADLERVTKKWKKQIFRQAELIFKNDNRRAINKMFLRDIGDFKNTLKNWLVKIHLDMKFRDTDVLKRAGEPFETEAKPIPKPIQFSHESVIEFEMTPEFDPWKPMPIAQSLTFFNAKRIARVIEENGKKKVITLGKAKELAFYDDTAFAISGVESANVLNKSKQIMFDAIESGDQKTAFKNLDNLFAQYIDEGAISENLRDPNRIKTIIRTNSNTAANRGRDALYDDPDVDEFVPFVQISAIIDGRTTEFCLGMDGKTFKKADVESPPFHFNCRTVLVPVTIIEAEEEKPQVSDFSDQEAAIRADNVNSKGNTNPSAVRGVGFGGTQPIKNTLEIFNQETLDFKMPSDTFVASTSAEVGMYNIRAFDAPVLHIRNNDERIMTIGKILISSDIQRPVISLIKDMFLETTDNDEDVERIQDGIFHNPAKVGSGNMFANAACWVWNGEGTGLVGLTGGEHIKSFHVGLGESKAGVGKIMLKQGQSLTIHYNYDPNTKGQILNGAEFECSVKFGFA